MWQWHLRGCCAISLTDALTPHSPALCRCINNWRDMKQYDDHIYGISEYTVRPFVAFPPSSFSCLSFFCPEKCTPTGGMCFPHRPLSTTHTPSSPRRCPFLTTETWSELCGVDYDGWPVHPHTASLHSTLLYVAPLPTFCCFHQITCSCPAGENCEERLEITAPASMTNLKIPMTGTRRAGERGGGLWRERESGWQRCAWGASKAGASQCVVMVRKCVT